MSAELFVGIVAVIGFAIGAAIWARCERYVRTRKGIIMVSCIGVVLIFGKLLISLVEDLPDNSTQQVMGAVVVLGVLSALLGVPFLMAFCVCAGCTEKRRKGPKSS